MTRADLLLAAGELQAIRDLLGSQKDTFVRVRMLRDALAGLLAVLNDDLDPEQCAAWDAAHDALKLAGVTDGEA